MSMIRNLLTFFGVVAVIAISIFIFRPDVYNSAIGKQSVVPQNLPSGQMFCMLSAQRGGLIEDPAAGSDSIKFALPELIDGEAVDAVPPPNAPFLMVINKSKNELRYWRLNKNVRKITVRDNSNAAFDVKLKELSTTPNAPFQGVLWIPRDTDLKLKFELGPIKS